MNRVEGSYQLSHAYDHFLDVTADPVSYTHLTLPTILRV